jgi:hypothetical protein
MKIILDEAGVDFDDRNTIAPKEKMKSIFDFFVIRQTNIVHKNFQIFFSLVCICSSMIYVYFAAFRFDVESFDTNYMQGNIRSFTLEKLEKFEYIFYFSEGVCFIDFITQFCLEYQSCDDPFPVK